MEISSLKTYIFIATTAVGVTLYVHNTFATNESLAKTNKKVVEIEGGQQKNSKILCLMALEQGVKRQKLEKYCDLDL